MCSGVTFVTNSAVGVRGQLQRQWRQQRRRERRQQHPAHERLHAGQLLPAQHDEHAGHTGAGAKQWEFESRQLRQPNPLRWARPSPSNNGRATGDCSRANEAAPSSVCSGPRLPRCKQARAGDVVRERISFCDSAVIAFCKKLDQIVMEEETAVSGARAGTRAATKPIAAAEEFARVEHEKRGSGWTSGARRKTRHNDSGSKGRASAGGGARAIFVGRGTNGAGGEALEGLVTIERGRLPPERCPTARSAIRFSSTPVDMARQKR